MRTAEIEVGGEYAYQQDKYGGKYRVKVLATGQPYASGYSYRRKVRNEGVLCELVERPESGWVPAPFRDTSADDGLKVGLVRSKEILYEWAKEEANRQYHQLQAKIRQATIDSWQQFARESLPLLPDGVTIASVTTRALHWRDLDGDREVVVELRLPPAYYLTGQAKAEAAVAQVKKAHYSE